jgi:hypothetical protein
MNEAANLGGHASRRLLLLASGSLTHHPAHVRRPLRHHTHVRIGFFCARCGRIHIHDDRSGLALPGCQDRCWNRTGPCFFDHKPRDTWHRCGSFQMGYLRQSGGSLLHQMLKINHLLTPRSPNANDWRELDHHVGPCDATEVDAFFGRSYLSFVCQAGGSRYGCPTRSK